MKSMFSLKDKTFVVTGGTGILGYAFNKSIAAQGGNVVIIGRNIEKAKARSEEINSLDGGRSIAIQADVTSLDDLNNAAEIAVKEFGQIDGLINGAGGNMPGAVVAPDKDVFELDFNALKQVMDLNLFGTLLPTQVFGKLTASKGNNFSIVNISSVSAHQTLTRVLGYSLAKSAIEAYTKWFAVELANRYGDQFRINAIVPGFFLTEQNRDLLTNKDGTLTDRGNSIVRETPYKRFGNADELSGALIYLLSEASTFVNGTSMVVDGGFLINSGV